VDVNEHADLREHVDVTGKWLSAEEQRAWRGLITLHRELMVRVNRRLQLDSQLSGADYEVLVALSEAPDGRMRPFEMLEALQWEQSRLSHHIGRMQNRGLVMREECSADGRGSVIVLTPSGRATIEAAAPAHASAVRALLFDALSPAQVAALEDIAATALGSFTPPVKACEQARRARRSGKR
jgi:DNA-binding MarR family transcriptional regulator